MNTTKRRSLSAVVFAVLTACGGESGAARAGLGGELDPSLPQSTPGAESSGAHTRESLGEAVDALLDGIKTNGADGLLAPGARVTQNGTPVALGSCLLAQARGYPYRALFTEPATGQAGVLGTAEVGESALLFSLRVKVAGDKLSEVELITVRPGEGPFAAPTALSKPSEHYDAVVPPGERQTREQLVAVADAYFDGIEAASGESVPFSDGCTRVENGVQTTRNPILSPFTAFDCRRSLGTLGYIEDVRDRRYPLVDVERGLVLALSMFDIPGGPYMVHLPGQTVSRNIPANSLRVAEIFKVVGGKIERIEAVVRNEALGATSAWPASGS